MKKNICILLILFISYTYLCASQHYDIIVAQDGSGDCKTITEALTKLSKYSYMRAVIFIKNGVYEERLHIRQDNITFIGESRDNTIIQFNLVREDWIKNKDYIGPAVINIHADDIILKNLTIKNTQPTIGPHAFTIYGTGTRTILVNCSVTSKGGDTVSLWNYKNGMFYHAGCHFEGAVDFVCPRGWCYIKNSTFYEWKETATIWHAAPLNKDQKFVIKDSYFDGVEGFNLGRHHYEARFYLINCKFSKNMIDRPIYRVTYPENPAKDRPYFWGDRYYFYHCEREGGNYSWFADNLSGISPDQITPGWTFDSQWDPEATDPPQLLSCSLRENYLELNFDENLTIRGDVTLKTSSGKILRFVMGKGRKTLRFESEKPLSADDIVRGLAIESGEIIVNEAFVQERKVNKEIDLSGIDFIP